MSGSNNKCYWIFQRIKRFANWIRRIIYLIIVAFMIGFSNAYLDENRMINDIANKTKQEQVVDNEDTNI